jgi:PncC family amidohydrolase
MVQEMITKNSGSSAYFLGGLVSYSNEVKSEVLKVKKKTIDTYGAVSREVAEEMVKSCCQIFKTDICGAITGIAGPSGGTKTKPVGLVHIAISVHFKMIHQQFNFQGDRDLIRKKAVLAIYKMILDNL